MNKVFKLQLLSLLLACFCINLSAQLVSDPYYFSGSVPVGTARFTAMGGAFSSLGGDISAVSLNPAGGAVFVNNQADFSLGITNFSSNVIGQASTLTEVNMPSAGVMFSIPMTSGDWKAFNVGLSTTRVKNFGRDLEYVQTTSAPNSIIDFFLARAGNIPPEFIYDESFYGALAYNTFALEYDTATGSYFTYAGGDSEHRVQFQRTGRTSEYDVNFSANWNNKLYLGANIGVSNMEIDEEFSNLESFDDTLTSLRYTEDYRRSGSAFVFKLGAIYRVNENIRLSGYYHIPRHYRLTTSFGGRLETRFQDGSGYQDSDGFQDFDYRLRLPARYGGGVAVILPKVGLFSMEVEKSKLANSNLGLFQPGDASFSADQNFYAIENAEIDSSYQDLITVRAGVEIKLNQLALRAGLQYQSKPLNDNVGGAFASNYSDRLYITAGLGYRISQSTSFDVYYRRGAYSENYVPFDGALNRKLDIVESAFGVGLSLYF